jgi:hypothetical protein
MDHDFNKVRLTMWTGDAVQYELNRWHVKRVWVGMFGSECSDLPAANESVNQQHGTQISWRSWGPCWHGQVAGSHSVASLPQSGSWPSEAGRWKDVRIDMINYTCDTSCVTMFDNFKTWLELNRWHVAIPLNNDLDLHAQICPAARTVVVARQLICRCLFRPDAWPAAYNVLRLKGNSHWTGDMWQCNNLWHDRSGDVILWKLFSMSAACSQSWEKLSWWPLQPYAFKIKIRCLG